MHHAKIIQITGKSYRIKDYKEESYRISNLVIYGPKTYIFEKSQKSESYSMIYI